MKNHALSVFAFLLIVPTVPTAAALFAEPSPSAPIIPSPVEPYALTVEYMTAPVGVDTPAPRLSWKSRTRWSGLENVVQTHYRVLVASTPERLAANTGDLWDSGKVESDRSLNIEYAGKTLESSQRCYWKVGLWYAASETPDGEKTALGPADGTWSEPSRWIMGVMRPEDWKAHWIATEEKYRKDWLDEKKTRWIWTGDAESLDKAPEGKRYYRKVFSSFDTIPEDVEKSLSEEFASIYAVLKITADDGYEVFLNGRKVTQTWGHFNDWKWMRFIHLPAGSVKRGDNVLAVAVTNKKPGPTGLLLELLTVFVPGPTGPGGHVLSSDGTWTSSAEPTEGWNSDPKFQSDKWKPVVEVGPVDCQPWGRIERRYELASPAFGKTFEVAKPVKEATLHITGLGFYEATLNGERIGDKVLDPAQTRYDKRVLYSTYDMSGSLKTGKNRIEVLLGHGWYDVRSVAVWNFDNAPWRDFCRMIAQLEIVYEDGSTETVCSDGSWDQIESPIVFDCIRQGEWLRNLKEPPEVIGTATVVDAPHGKLVASNFPGSVIAEDLKPVRITEPSPGVYVVDFGQNLAGWVRLEMDGDKDAEFVQFKYAERLTPDGRVERKPINEHFRHRFPVDGVALSDPRFPDDMFQIDTFYRTKGKEVYEPRFTYNGFQYVEITGLATPPTAETLRARVVQTGFKSAGKFECSNELFNKIQQATLWSYRGNFVNAVPTDCPHREKNGWTGDAHLAAEQAMYNWENTAAYEKWIDDLLDEQRPDGNLPGIVPTSGWGYAWGNGPAWDSAVVLIPWYLYQYKGDERILQRAYPAMKKYVDYLQSREKENGLVDHGLSDWCCANTRTPAVVTSSVYYYVDASLVATTAGILEKTDDAERYAALAEKIRAAYMKELLKEDGTIANGSQTAQSFATYYEMLYPGPTSKAVFAKLVEAVEKADGHLDVGILGAKTLFHTLSLIDRTDLVVRTLNQKTPHGYGDWLERGATTLWEDWGDGASRNHVMYGDVSFWFYRFLGGISPSEPAFKEIFIEPKFPKGIDWVRAEHDSPYGPVKVDWKRDGKNIVLNLSVPVNTTAIYNWEPLGSGEYTFEIEAE